MPVFVEDPLSRIVAVHWADDGEPPPDGGGGGPCMPYYAHPYMPLHLYQDGATMWVQPYYCCPPHFFENELDYGQKTVWGGGADAGTKITWTWNANDAGTGSGFLIPPEGAMGIWIYPRVKWTSWDKVWNYVDNPNGSKTLLSPKGSPVLWGPVPVLTYQVPVGLEPADIPGAPPADAGIYGTTIVLAPLRADGTGAYLNSPYVFWGATVEIEHICPPGSSPTEGIPTGPPKFQRPARPVRKR